MSKYYKKRESIITQAIDDSCLAMDNLSQEGAVVYLSDIAKEIFNLCDGKHSAQDIVKHICEIYDVEEQICIEDVDKCLREMCAANIIQTV
jgi:hypothetical protein